MAARPASPHTDPLGRATIRSAVRPRSSRGPSVFQEPQLRTPRLLERANAKNLLPEGTAPVAAGLVLAGLSAYAFLAVAKRSLSDDGYSSLGALWAFVFLIGPGFYLPVEQEVGRAISARRALGLGGGPVVRRAAVLAAGLGATLVVVTLATSPVLLSRLFDSQVLLLVGFLIAIVTYAAMHLTRGAYSGNGYFGAYGFIFGAEGVIRLIACGVLAVVGVETAGPYGLVMGLAPFVTLFIILRRERDFFQPGPDATWQELSVAMGWLLAASVFAQMLVNCAPIAAKVLANPAQSKVAGHVLSGLLIARIPLIFFQAVQAALLPKLAAQAAEGRNDDFRSGLRRLTMAVAAVGVIGSLAALTIGPTVVKIMFESDTNLTRSDLLFLAAASACIMLGLTFAQALIALGGYARAALGWAAGVVAWFVMTAIPSHDLLLRVERGFLVGTIVAFVTLAVLLYQRMQGMLPTSARELYTAVSHEFAEP
jgi:O-antigen/teichoic acid export membrane protein